MVPEPPCPPQNPAGCIWGWGPARLTPARPPSTVRTLGVLPGHELLQMSPAELRGVCPEEWRRVLFKLSPIRTSLGVRGAHPRTPTPHISGLSSALSPLPTPGAGLGGVGPPA